MKDEVAELAADLRAVLEDMRLRGVQELPVAEAVPAPAPEVPPRRADPGPDRWGQMASAARERVDEGTGELGLAAVRDDLGDCRRCGLCRDRRNIVFGVGNPNADLVVIGEAPGYHEDECGEPFVGPAGQMLDKMLENVIGLSRQQTYICNVIKCRPPKNRNPLPDEVAACRPFLVRQVRAIRPKVLLVLGRVALNVLWDSDAGIKRSRGIWKEWQGIPALPTFHPAYLLRQPQDKRQTFNDLKALKERYDELGGWRPG